MDAVEFLKAKVRMCANMDSCTSCGLYKEHTDCDTRCFTHPDEAVAAVEKWAKEHPVKTRQSEFLKMFPNARIESDGMPSICPIIVDKRCYNKDDDALCCFVRDEEKCRKCRRNFWLKEIK